MSKTKSARIDDEELLNLLEERGEDIEGGSSEVIRRALRNHLYGEKLGLSDEDYDRLIVASGTYFHELGEGNYDEAMEIGEEIYDTHTEFGDAVAKITVYMEENSWL